MPKKVSKAIDGESLTITFADESKFATTLDTYPDDIKIKLAMHGLSQKLGDSCAGAEPEECADKINSVHNELVAGNWTSRVAGSSTPRSTMLAEALAQVAEVSIEEAAAKLAEKSDEEKKAIRNHSQIKAALAQIKAAKAAEAAQKAAETAGDSPALSL